MDRLTKKYGDEIICNVKYCNTEFCLGECYGCEHFKEIKTKLAHYEDLEEAGRLVELPCAVGDTVYGIRRYQGVRKVQSGIVSEMYFSQKNRLIIVIKNIGRGYWGESIFGSSEEAEAALKECESE